MVDPLLEFVAEHVGTDTTEYTQQCVVYMIAFGKGDPEQDGHCWTFSRSFDDDWGVCTVREIQRATIYGGIESFRLHRSGLECLFDPKAAEEAGYRELRISFTVDDEKWRALVATAEIVFKACPYFILVP